jgi:hypothetical protein
VLGGSALRWDGDYSRYVRCGLRFRLLGRHDMACAAVASARVWGVHVLASAVEMHSTCCDGKA